jgi:soluble lytic murein transglycosylase
VLLLVALAGAGTLETTLDDAVLRARSGWTEDDPERQFVAAWTMVREGRAAEAAPLAAKVEASTLAPGPYRELLLGELYLADRQLPGAIDHLEQVPADSPLSSRATLALEETYYALGRTADARRVLEDLAARPDPAPGSAAALWALAQRAGKGNPAAAGPLRRLYRHYPGTKEDRAATEWQPAPTIEDLAWRGDALQEAGRHAEASKLLESRLQDARADDCVYRYALGRAHHKLANLSRAAEVLAPLGPACKGKDDDRGAKALYLAARSLERRKEWAAAAQLFLAIPATYPAHSMADDGYAMGGIALQEAGDLAAARSAWAKGAAEYPGGDLAAENAWRLAFGAYLAGDLAGDLAEALRWSEHGGTRVPLAVAPTDVLGCRYWHARWTAWPTDKGTALADAGAKERAASELAMIASEAPWHYYGALAYSRLRELDPARAAALPRPVLDDLGAPWMVRTSFADATATKNAIALAQLGLAKEALAEITTHDLDGLTGAEMAIVATLESAASGPLLALGRLREWLKTRPPPSLGPSAWKVLRVAYPDSYWPEVQAAAKQFGWDPRIFHALVREESGFNPQIKSHAGACGLSQLMPGTASGCAKRMGLSYSSSKIWDPATNLSIGAYYLDLLHTRYKGNSALALAGYNAGEGNADRWLGELPADTPLDTYVESISFRETRHYVKRVLSTYQVYRVLDSQSEVYPDWSRYLVDAVP